MTRLELTISLGAIERNAMRIRARLAPNVKLMAVVKADAYGHGAVGVAERLVRRGLADALAVATIEEGAQLCSTSILNDTQILVLGAPMDDEQAQKAVGYRLSCAVYDEMALMRLSRAASKLRARARAQLKLDTGMARIGVRDTEALNKLLDAWTRVDNVSMDGVFTHFCAAGTDIMFTRTQNERFRRALELINARGFKPVRHAAASSALLAYEYQYGMVRAGIALYGTGAGALDSELEFAQTLTTYPTRVEWIEAGETVGYSRAFRAERKTRVMTLPCGYGDGYPRILGGRADVLVNGTRARLIGNVCMDMMMADVTDAGDIGEQSPVVILGAQGSERITPVELAQIAQTIPYEIMLGFSARVKRAQSE